MRAHVDKV
jgi:hypothetical protein